MDVNGGAVRRAARGAQGRATATTPRDTDLDRRRPQGARRGVQGDRQGRHRPRLPDRPATSSSTSRSRPCSRRWFGKRANDYRNSQKIAHDLGTAVNVVTMVFGNMGDDSGTGVAFTRDPNTGEKRPLRRVPDQRPGRGRRRRRPDAAPRSASSQQRHAGGLRRVPAHRPAARAALPRTSRTSSSRSSAAGCTCSRRATRSGPRRPP